MVVLWGSRNPPRRPQRGPEAGPGGPQDGLRETQESLVRNHVPGSLSGFPGLRMSGFPGRPRGPQDSLSEAPE
eukprot:4629313-Pyramimonas_sp.AAC.1